MDDNRSQIGSKTSGRVPSTKRAKAGAGAVSIDPITRPTSTGSIVEASRSASVATDQVIASGEPGPPIASVPTTSFLPDEASQTHPLEDTAAREIVGQGLIEPVAASPSADFEHVITEPAAEAATDAEPTLTPQPAELSAASGPISTSQKDTIMDTTSNFSSGLNSVLSEAQDKAKEVYEKSSSMLGDAGTFTRGNVEAVVESGKILAAGLQDLSTNLVAESRGAFETLTADLKELAAAKTPADFFKIQGEIARKNLDSAVAHGSKNSEAMLKLVTDALAPLSGRVNLAVDKAKSSVG